MEKTGKEEEEIDRADMWKQAREMKTGGFDLAVQKVVDKIVSIHIQHFYFWFVLVRFLVNVS